jgi:hypothetical protein
VDKLAADARELLYGRFLEAADVLQRLPPVKGPKEYGNGMPDIIRDYVDAVGAESERDKSEWAWPIRREPPTAAAITRTWEVSDWSNKYFKTPEYMRHWPEYRGCTPRAALWASAICAVGRRSFAGVCKRRGWARTTAWRRVDTGLLIVFSGLQSDLVSIKPAALDYAGQMEQFSQPQPTSSGLCAR